MQYRSILKEGLMKNQAQPLVADGVSAPREFELRLLLNPTSSVT